jgi:hypothetical protein
MPNHRLPGVRVLRHLVLLIAAAFALALVGVQAVSLVQSGARFAGSGSPTLQYRLRLPPRSISLRNSLSQAKSRETPVCCRGDNIFASAPLQQPSRNQYSPDPQPRSLLNYDKSVPRSSKPTRALEPHGKHLHRYLTAASIRGVAQSGSAPGSGPGGRRFESSRPDHFPSDFPQQAFVHNAVGNEMIVQGLTLQYAPI